MKKYVRLTVVVAAVVLLGAHEASARGGGGRAMGGRGGAAGMRFSPGVSRPHFNLPSGGRNAVVSHGLTHQQWQQNAAQIRNNVQGRYHHVFTPQWYANHTNPSHNRHWHPNIWAPVVGWAALANWVGVDGGDPYDYSTVYSGDTYYVTDDGTPVEQSTESSTEQPTEPSTEQSTTTQDTEDPADLASQGNTDETTGETNPSDWLPLGVFTITPPNSKATPDRLFQFSVNKNGQIAGSYYDALSGGAISIQGAVNKKTQRAAWTVGTNKDMVMETNLGSFTENQANILVHQGKDRTEQWMMVRIDGPAAGQANTQGTSGQTNSQGATDQTNPQSSTNPTSSQGTTDSGQAATSGTK